MFTSQYTHKTILALTATILAAGGAQAYELNLGTNMPSVDFHGFASQGFLASSSYDYLANNTKDGSFQFSEAGINASINPFARTRIAAQGFLFDVGNVGQYHPFRSITRRSITRSATPSVCARAASAAPPASTTTSRT